ncbi:hypothetical protein J3R30DRAFT_3408064 [Lentinula aciculospora]|uniref:Uncharacterized protein n=1 Tax=Lentinula aciculospora TaxID=153920 RepID=A0A9W9DII9_9AGAR|nr:hypothetical protein J3R30DRAFT_3408064 [Lentinula aciculospora]
MFTSFSEQSKLMFPTHTNWFYDKLVDFQYQRPHLSYAVRLAVWQENDQMKEADKKTTIKHHVPWIRICRRLLKNMLSEGHEAGKGMTRAESVLYINTLLDKLEINRQQFKIPDADPENDQYSYDKWMTWALETICDWPDNLFQGPSAGDGAGTKIDMPSEVPGQTTPGLRQRVEGARLKLGKYIKGLDINLYEVDDPPMEHEKYVPTEDEWYMPQ